EEEGDARGPRLRGEDAREGPRQENRLRRRSSGRGRDGLEARQEIPDDIQDAASGPGQPAEDRRQAREKAGEPDRKEAFNLGGGEVSRGFTARVRVSG